MGHADPRKREVRGLEQNNSVERVPEWRRSFVRMGTVFAPRSSVGVNRIGVGMEIRNDPFPRNDFGQGCHTEVHERQLVGWKWKTAGTKTRLSHDESWHLHRDRKEPVSPGVANDKDIV